jgi:3-oxoacyl-[acyl-carrier-protein] synthase II
MTSTKRRAVFTGLGLLTPVGTDPQSFLTALHAGTCGLKPITHFDPAALKCKIAGVITGFDSRKVFPATMKDARKSIVRMARPIQLGVAAAQLCMTDGGPTPEQVTPERFGVEFGCLMGASEPEDLARGGQLSCEGDPPAVDMAKWGSVGLPAVPPLWMLKYLPNMPACHVSINCNAQGPNNTITAVETAGLLALGEAFRLLGRNAADYFLVGGCDSRVNPLSQSRYNSFAPLTTTHDATPEQAVRPFDADRDGSVIGEAAAVFGLEAAEVAAKRGAKVYAEMVGFASGFDKGRKGDILAKVIGNALRDAGISPDDVDHVNASAGGVVDTDAWEARGIRAALGDVPVVAYKANVGNTGAASGLVELAASVLALHGGSLPGTINCPKVGADCPVSVQVGSRAVTKPAAVKVSVTEAGQVAVAVIRRVGEPRVSTRG